MLESQEIENKFRKLSQKVQSHELMRKPRPPSGQTKRIAIPRLGLGSIRISLEDIENGIIAGMHAPDTPSSIESSLDSDIVRDLKDKKETIKSATKPVLPYMKVTLRKSEIIVLFEQNSCTVLRDSEEGRYAEEDNKIYEYLTQGKGATRRRVDAITQTSMVLFKTRSVNTESIRQGHVGSYVSNYEMFDTYKDLEKSTQSIDVDGQQQLQVTTYKVRGVDKFIEINNNPNFKLALMLMMRCLAGNVFEKSQRRFRNMNMPDPLAMDVRYRYRLQLLWRYWPQSLDESTGHTVADMSWCHCNGDILAVAYGIYSHSADHLPQNGYVCIWNIKNPVNPERFYNYNVPVVSVEFSSFVPQLLAIGLYDGSIEVRDITFSDSNPVAISERKTSPSYEAMMALKWINDGEIDDGATCSVGQQALLALSQDGSVTKYRIINSPYLLGFQQILLDRVEGNAEGLPVKRSWDTMEANRHPQGLSLSIHPTQADIFYALTDEGCFYKCSTNYPQEQIQVWQAHDAAINALEFSPWSPKLFLTCGNDWCVRIWMDGILKPLITLSNEIGPIHNANWSKTHSTIIVAVNRKHIEVWDIRRSTLKPVSTYNIDESYNTMFKFTNCGRSIAVGNERGHVVLLSFEDMPFPPYFQYEELESAILKAIACDADLTKLIKSFDYFGYPDEERDKKKKEQKKKKKKLKTNKSID